MLQFEIYLNTLSSLLLKIFSQKLKQGFNKIKLRWIYDPSQLRIQGMRASKLTNYNRLNIVHEFFKFFHYSIFFDMIDPKYRFNFYNQYHGPIPWLMNTTSPKTITYFTTKIFYNNMTRFLTVDIHPHIMIDIINL